MDWVFNDGGRADAGYNGTAGDCACRALSIATGMSYKDAYKMINEYAKHERVSKRKKSISNARTGVYVNTFKKIMKDLGWRWKATMQIGSGCHTHLRADELPSGKIICNVSKHFVAVIDGVINDTYDCSRDGTRCVYGYWYKE